MKRVSLLLLLIGCDQPPAPNAPKTEVSRALPAPVVTSEAVRGVETPTAWADGERFRIHVEQKGKTVALVDHRATLAKEPFDIVMLLRVDETRDAFSISLHASTDPSEMAKAGRLASGAPLTDADFGDGAGAAEEWFDKDHALFARDGHHEIMWFGDQEHRCAKATRLSKDTLSCTRTVEKLIGPGGNEISTHEAKELLLVFAKLDHRGARAVEKQRDWVVLKFE